MIIELFSRGIFCVLLLMDKILREQNTNRNKLLFTLILRLNAVHNNEGNSKIAAKAAETWAALSILAVASPQLMEHNKQQNKCSCKFNDSH